VRIDASTRALVTGASRGIGRALAEALAGRGATVGLAARSRDEIEALAEELPGDHVALPCDVADRRSVEEAVAAFVESAGGLDLVVANAGIARYGPFRETGVEAVEDMTAVNWLGTVYTVGAALPHLLDHAHGHVVIVSSGAGQRSFPGAAGYGATKAAQRMFGEALRHELGGTGVSVTMVYPGEIATSLHDHEKERMPDWYRGGPSAASAEALASKVLAGVEADARAVHFPALVRLMGAVHGISPRLSDRLLRTLRGATAAPRRD
jgi:NADP-dependent 3-hydroxy acid dehydrogenase YdfG